MTATPTMTRTQTQDIVQQLIPFYENLTAAQIDRFNDFYAENAQFRDPFNHVTNLEAIKKIFGHMFVQVNDPAFTVSKSIIGEGDAILFWQFHFRFRGLGNKCPQSLEGVSHLAFAPDGKVTLHRDYWDAAEELYSRLPVVGLLMRGLQRMIRA